MKPCQRHLPQTPVPNATGTLRRAYFSPQVLDLIDLNPNQRGGELRVLPSLCSLLKLCGYRANPVLLIRPTPAAPLPARPARNGFRDLGIFLLSMAGRKL